MCVYTGATTHFPHTAQKSRCTKQQFALRLASHSHVLEGPIMLVYCDGQSGQLFSSPVPQKVSSTLRWMTQERGIKKGERGDIVSTHHFRHSRSEEMVAKRGSSTSSTHGTVQHLSSFYLIFTPLLEHTGTHIPTCFIALLMASQYGDLSNHLPGGEVPC